VSNAIYVDYLELRGDATNFQGSNVVSLVFDPSLVIYYAQAVANGKSVAEKINHGNNNHLRWIPAYAGHFSSTNLISGGVTNAVNAALLQSTNVDSDGDGINNKIDPTPFFLSSQVNFTVTTTNLPPLQVLLQWQTFPTATNYVLYTTNLVTPNWQVLTNFVTPVLPPSPPVTVSILDSVNPVQRYYRVRIDSPQP